MSFADPSGFDFNDSQSSAPVEAHWNAAAALQLAVYSLQSMSESAPSEATASRWPLFVSHAMATSSSTGFLIEAVISTKFPNALPSQIQTLASSFVSSPPMSPIWSLVFLDASLINEYWMSVACPASSRYCSALHVPPT